MKQGVKKGKDLRSRNLTWLLLMLAVIALANYIGTFVFARADLTSEKRYTLSETSKKLLAGLHDVIYVRVYLHGDFPPGFKRLETASREMLDEMRVYAGDNLQYRFIDPSASGDAQQRNELYGQLARKGLTPTNLQETGRDSKTQKIIFPGALITYTSRETGVQLLKDRIGATPEAMLNNSILNLEYEFSNAFRKIISTVPERIAFIGGHEELDQKYLADIAETLRGFYEVEQVTLGGRLKALKGIRTAVVAKPRLPFDEKDKFVLDQFIMKGGRVLWLIDPLLAEMDSLSAASEILAVSTELNLDDMLFRYGVRINKNLVQDIMAAPIPVVTGNIGNKAQQQFLPWYYFPLVIPQSVHPIVRNLNAIRFQFAGSIDTVGAPGIRKTILLTTSPYAKSTDSPVRVSLEVMRGEPERAQFNKANLPLAVLLEGRSVRCTPTASPRKSQKAKRSVFAKRAGPPARW